MTSRLIHIINITNIFRFMHSIAQYISYVINTVLTFRTKLQKTIKQG